MIWSIFFSFFLIVVTYHPCDRFGDLLWQSSSVRRIGWINHPLPVGLPKLFAQVSFFPYRLVTWSAQFSLLLFLDSSTKDSFSFCFLKCWEECCAGSEFCFVVVNFIHKSTRPSWYSHRKMYSHDCEAMELQFQVHIGQYFHGFLNSTTGPIIVHPQIAAKTQDWCVLEKVCTPDLTEQVTHIRPLRQVEFYPSSWVTRCLSQAFSHSFENWILSYNVSKLKMFSCRLFPDAVFGGGAKSCRSCDGTLVNILLFTDRSSRPFFFLCQAAFIVHTNSPLLREHWADSQNELVGTRALCSSNLQWSCMLSFSFFLFRIPRVQALMLFNTGSPVSLNRCTAWSTVESHSPLWWYEDLPYHFFTDPGPRNVQCLCKNLFA